MKFRTTHNSIRYRLKKSELAMLSERGNVEEVVTFPNGVDLIAALRIDAAIEDVDARFENNSLILSISAAIAKAWTETNQVGIERHLDLPKGERLHVLIEKDFPCLDRPNEDKSDTFWELAPEAPDAC